MDPAEPARDTALSRRALLGTGAAGILAAGLLTGTGSAAHGVPPNEHGYDLWLRYRRVPDAGVLNRYRAAFDHVVVRGDHEILRSAAAELSRGLSGLLDRDVPVREHAGKGAVVVTTGAVAGVVTDDDLQPLGPEGFVIRRMHDSVLVVSSGERGALYGAFRFLAHLQRQRPLRRLEMASSPAAPLRMLDHWDNLDRTVERGYAGKSIFHWDELPDLRTRYTDYARILASVGINHTVVNNVNASAEFLRTERLEGLAALADVLRAWGIQLSLSANYASPMTLTADDANPITVADPADPRVQEWWRDKIDEIYALIPDFGGFLVKANSEGQPGPLDYGRTHAEGANMLAERLLPHNGRLVWRSFVHEGFSDWAEYQYRAFHPLDGDFDDNAIVQTKNGPIDFQVREPVNPLFGGMPRTNQMIELQITQEYTGQSTHLCYLVPQWKEILDFPTHTGPDDGPTVADIVTGNAYHQTNVGLAGVANLGDDHDWTGYQLGAANLHGFARLAWDPRSSAEDIVAEWIELTFGVDHHVVDALGSILLRSWTTYEDYTSPLGIGYLTYPLGTHFDPNPISTRDQSHYTNDEGTGFDRTSATGSGFTGLLSEHWSALYESLDECPDELLLFMHWVPYTHQLHSGKTVIQHIYDSHFDGLERVRAFRRTWHGLADRVDAARHADITASFDSQLAHAERWRDAVVSFFFGASRVLSTRDRWLQVGYPQGRLIFGGTPHRLPVEIINATDTEQHVSASVHRIDSDWRVERRSATVGSNETVTLGLPVTTPMVADLLTVSIDIDPGITALEAKEQSFVITPAPDICHLALDVGTTETPVVDGYDRLTPETAWDETQRFGWHGSAPQSRDRGSIWDPLRRDLCGDYPAHTLRVRLPAGRLRLWALVGDAGPDAPPTIISEGGDVLASSPYLPGGTYVWLDAELDGGPSGRLADLTFSSEPDKFWHVSAVVVTDA